MRATALDHIGIAVPSAVDQPLVRALGGDELGLVEMPSGVAVARFGPGRQLERPAVRPRAGLGDADELAALHDDEDDRVRMVDERDRHAASLPRR